ncbi:ephexin-1-like protein, partial [Dinothrombium tinctorium]
KLEKPYLTYCENHLKQEKTLIHLRQSNSMFSDYLKELENDSICQKLSFHSFLILPIQRVTRYVILIEAILSNAHFQSSEMINSCKETLYLAKRLAIRCNEAIKRDRSIIDLKFPKTMPKISLSNDSRELIRKGEAVQFYPTKQVLNYSKEKFLLLYRFSDIFLIASMKSQRVIDYCNISQVKMQK